MSEFDKIVEIATRQMDDLYERLRKSEDERTFYKHLFIFTVGYTFRHEKKYFPTTKDYENWIISVYKGENDGR